MKRELRPVDVVSLRERIACPAEVNENRTNSDPPVVVCVFESASAFLCAPVQICAYGTELPALRVCTSLAVRKDRRLGERCRETLQGLERMLIKASYSTASSFLTVPAAGSTTLRFLPTSSPLYLSALLYFCLLLFLSPFPRLRLTCFPPPGLPRLPCGSSNGRCFHVESTAM